MVRRIPADGARYAPASGVRYVQGDFFADTDAEDWLTRLAGVDAVVNAVGILRECGAQTFDARTCVHLPLSSPRAPEWASSGLFRSRRLARMKEQSVPTT